MSSSRTEQRSFAAAIFSFADQISKVGKQMEPSSGGCWAYVSGGPSGHSHCNQTCCCCFLRGDLWRSQINLISRVVRSRLSLTPISPLTHFLFNAYAKICTSLFETRGGHILIVSLLAELLVPKSCIDVCMWARVSTCANNVGVDIAGQGEDARIRRATDVGATKSSTSRAAEDNSFVIHQSRTTLQGGAPGQTKPGRS